MQELHFVGFTSNHEGLLLSPHEDATSGDYFVQIDEYLAAAIEQRPGSHYDGQSSEENYREEQQSRQEARVAASPAPPLSPPRVPRPAARTRPKPASHLSPREIQARLRGGSSVAEVAQEAGVDEEWVLRFADPILAEQSRVVQRALQLTFTKPRVGPSTQPLRESVRWNLADQGALRDDAVFDAGWSAFNLQGSKWVVRFSFSAKRRRKAAEWEVDLRQGELKGRNRIATDLGYVEPTRRRKPPPEELPPAASPTPRRHRRRDKAAQKAPTNKAAKAAKAAKAKAAAKGGTARGSKSAAKKSARKAAARPAAPTKSAPRKASKKSAPKKATAPRTAAKKVAAKKVTGKKVTGKKKATAGTTS